MKKPSFAKGSQIFALCAAALCLMGSKAFGDTGYVAVESGATIIHSSSNAITGSISPLGTNPLSIAISQSKGIAYVVNQNSGNVSVIDLTTNTVVGSPISVGSQPFGISVSPDEAYVYVTVSGALKQIDTTSLTVTNTFASSGLVGSKGCSISPDGSFIYICVQTGTPGVVVLDISDPTSIVFADFISDSLLGSPYQMVLSSDGATGYVTNINDERLTIVDLITPLVVGSVHMAGSTPEGLAITLDDAFVYVTDSSNDAVNVIDTSSKLEVGFPILVGASPKWIAITSNGLSAYVTNSTDGTVSVIDLGSNIVTDVIASIGTAPQGIAFAPSFSSFSSPSSPPPPSSSLDAPASISGSQKKNNFGLVYERFNAIKWTASPSSGVTGYNVYRNDVLVATLSSSQLSYNDHNQKQQGEITYGVSAFNDSDESTPIAIEFIDGIFYPVNSL